VIVIISLFQNNYISGNNFILFKQKIDVTENSV